MVRHEFNASSIIFYLLMFHQIRWTAQKTAQRLSLADSLVYRRRTMLPPFRFRPLTGPEEIPPISATPKRWFT
jgi:hypothetical protein